MPARSPQGSRFFRSTARGSTLACVVESDPVEGHAPPGVPDPGSARSIPQPYMRPAANPGPVTVGAELVKALRSIR